MRSLSVIGLAVLLIVGLFALPSWATACGTHANFFDGRTHDPSTGEPYGAWAEINVRNAELCTPTDQTDSTAWTMIGRDNDQGYFQVGYVKNNNGRFKFTETNKDGGSNFTFETYGIVNLDSKWGFKSRIESDGYGHMSFCSPKPNPVCSELKKTGWKPFDTWSGTKAHFYGETQHTQTDVPGTSSNKTNFSEVQEIKGSGSWYSGSTSPIISISAYKQEFVSDSHFKIWTER